jgi:hypothetical protein
VGPAVARSRSIGGRLNSAPGQLGLRQTDESMIAVLSAPFSSGGSIVGTFLRLGSEAGTVTAVPKLSPIRREYKNRDDAILVAYESGAYSYQQIAKHLKFILPR